MLTCANQTWAEAGFGFTKPAFLGSRLRLPRFLRGLLRLRDFQRLAASASWFTKASTLQTNLFSTIQIAWLRLLNQGFGFGFGF